LQGFLKAPRFLFSAWDVLFGTFHMPENRLPSRYGVDEADYPQGFLGQLVHPFQGLRHVSISPAELSSKP
jgi:sterol desaturase/sphingolipid hydroxylase (fatty acid hydroxylase superfamily)